MVLETDIQADLTDKVKRLEGLTQIIAHNLRGAALTIQMLSEVLKSKKIPAIDSDAETNTFTTGEAIELIHLSSTSMLDTLDTIMEVAKTQLDNDIRRELCDISNIVKQTTYQLQVFIKQKRAVIELHLDVPFIGFPKFYMESIFYNLIDNALKYSNPEVPLKIIISTYSQNDRVTLSVKDNGLGIDMDANWDRIFNLNECFHPGYDSKGIGLYITRTQIESLGGNINVLSKVNEGSEFIVVF